MSCDIRGCEDEPVCRVLGDLNGTYSFCWRHGHDLIHPGWRELNVEREAKALRQEGCHK